MKLSVVIPAYNEEDRILGTLEDVESYLSSRDYESEIIVVDDGSKDGTYKIVEDFKIKSRVPINILKNGINRGKGYSVKRGMLNSKGEYALFMDADNSTEIIEIEKCWEFFKQSYDVIIGSRSLPESNILIEQPWYRRLMGRIFNLFVQLVAIKGFPDTQCGFKVFKRKTIEPIFKRQTIDRWGFDAEILFIAKKLGFKIGQIPVAWRDSSKSHINPLKDSFNMFMELLSIRIKDLMGKYK